MVFAKCYEPLGERFGIFAIKGIVQFNKNLAHIVVGNRSAKEITLAVGTKVAKIESFDEEDYETHEWKGADETEETKKAQALAQSKAKARRFVVTEETPNKMVHWKPIIRRKQAIIVDSTLKLTRLVDSEIHNIAKCSETVRGSTEFEKAFDEEFVKGISTGVPPTTDAQLPKEADYNLTENEDKPKETQCKKPHEEVKID